MTRIAKPGYRTRYGRKALAHLLAGFGAGLRTEPVLYDISGHQVLIRGRKAPKGCFPRGVLHKIVGKQDLEKARTGAIGMCVKSGRQATEWYSKSPPIAELFAPVLEEGKVIAVLGSGPLLVQDPPSVSFPDIPRKVHWIPGPLLKERLAFIQEAASCIEAVTKMRRQREAVERIIHAINRSKTSRALFRGLLGELLPLVGARVGFVFLLDEEGEELVLAQHIGPPLNRPFSLKKGEGICWRAVERRKPVRVGDVTKDRDYVKIWDEIRSAVASPLLYEGRVLGVLDIETSRENAFSKEDETFFGVLGRMTAAAIAKREQLRDADLVGRVAVELFSARRLKETLNAAVHAITEGMRARLCYLFLSEPDEPRVVLRAASKGFEDLVGTLSYDPGEDFIGTVLQEKKEAILTRPENGKHGWADKYRDEWNKRTGKEPIYALAAAPLIHKKKREDTTIGVICLVNRLPEARSHYFSQRDRAVLRVLADLIASAIAQAQQFEMLKQLCDKQQTGLCIIRKPANWEEVKNKPIRELTHLDMRIVYANHKQKENFEIDERVSICYDVYNKFWKCILPCPWCPVLRVFHGADRAEAVTHSPTGPHGIVRHYKVIASRYVDDVTGENAALESIMDMTESVELQDLFGRLVRANQQLKVYEAIAETVGRTFQSIEGLVLSKEAEGWVASIRFHYLAENAMSREKGILDSLYAHCDEDPLMAYLEERIARAPTTYEFDRPEAENEPLDTESQQWVVTMAGRVRFLKPEEIPSNLQERLLNKEITRLMVLPVPILQPTGLIIFGEDGPSKFLSNPPKEDEAEVVRADAGAVCVQAAHGAQLALERIQREQDLQKAPIFLDRLISAVADGTSIEECFKQHVPELLGAQNFSLFSLDPNDHLLHLVTTTGMLHEDGRRYSEEELANVTYRVSADDGLTGWIALYGEPLNVPLGCFKKEKLKELFERQIQNRKPEIKEPPVHRGKYNENRAKEHCYLGMPIFSSARAVIGVCRVTGKRPDLANDWFSESDELLLQACCSILGLVMELRHQVIGAERLVGRTVAHALLNALPHLLDYPRYIIEDNPGLSVQSKGYLNVLSSEIRRAADIVDEFYRFATGTRMEPSLETTPGGIVKEMADWLLKLTGAPTFKIEEAIESVEGTIFINPEAIRYIYDNLFRNALMHSGREQGDLVITLGCSHVPEKVAEIRHVCLFFEDNGSGIPRDLRDKVLLPFVGHGGRTGLGLTLVHELVRQMAGSFRVSESRTGGARFEMLFPLKEGDNE